MSIGISIVLKSNNFQQLLPSKSYNRIIEILLFFFKHLDLYFFLWLLVFPFLKHLAAIRERYKRDETRLFFFSDAFFFRASVVQRQKIVIRHYRFFIRIIWSVLRVYLGCIDEYFASRGIRDSIFKRNMILACASSLRVHVKRMKRISNSEKEFHPNGGRRGISIRKLEAHFRIVYFGARWTTIGIQGARIPLCASIASICIRIDRFETCPTFSGCRIFIDNRPRYNPRFFSTSKLKKKSFKAFNSVF